MKPDEYISEVIMDIRRSPKRPMAIKRKVRKVRKVKADYTCPYCAGDGHVEGPENLYSCHCEHCDGTGKIIDDGLRKCPKCDRNMLVDLINNDYTVRYQCEHCHHVEEEMNTHNITIPEPAVGQTLWNPTTHTVQVWNGTSWADVGGNLVSVTGASSVTGTLSDKITLGFMAMTGGLMAYYLYRNRMGR